MAEANDVPFWPLRVSNMVMFAIAQDGFGLPLEHKWY